MRICYFGGYDRDHPRNRVLTTGLAAQGADVVECHSRHPLRMVRVASLVARYLALGRTAVVVVGAPGHGYVLVAWVLARWRGAPLVVDAFVSRLESWEEEPGPSRLGRWLALGLDRLSAVLADVVLVDTEEHAAYFRDRLGLPSERVAPVPVGAPDEVFGRRVATCRGPLRVLFAGSWLPLHGTDVILDAIARLSDESEIEFELIGAGLAAGRPAGLPPDARVRLHGAMPYAEYASRLAEADVALGAFGTTPKAGRVVPCKVYDALAAGVPVITGDTPAVRRLLGDGCALLVPPGDPQALAGAIVRLGRDPALRANLAATGSRLMEAIGRPAVVGEQVLGLCRRLAGVHRRGAGPMSEAEPAA